MAIVTAETPYRQTLAAGRAAIAVIKDGVVQGKFTLSRKEQQWLTCIESSLDELPIDEAVLIAKLEEQYGGLYHKASYGL